MPPAVLAYPTGPASCGASGTLPASLPGRPAWPRHSSENTSTRQDSGAPRAAPPSRACRLRLHCPPASMPALGDLQRASMPANFKRPGSPLPLRRPDSVYRLGQLPAAAQSKRGRQDITAASTSPLQQRSPAAAEGHAQQTCDATSSWPGGRFPPSP